MNNNEIFCATAREILDSRGTPTVEAEVVLNDGTVGVASVPSGASVGFYEAFEKRDTELARYGGKGVHGAVNSIKSTISPIIKGKNPCNQSAVDRAMISADGSEDKRVLGANAILAVSLATARAAAKSTGQELFRYLGGSAVGRMPIPMMNILNGGLHASNNLEIQEFMIVPVGVCTLCEAVRAGSEIYHTLGKILKRRNLSVSVGDEGGYAPMLGSDEEAIDLISEAIVASGYSTDNIKISLDIASSGWYENGKYKTLKSGKNTDTDGLIRYYQELASNYPILSIEDGLAEDDFDGWKILTAELGDKIMLVGDDLFVTNEERLRRGISESMANSILIKPNQIGTLTETLNVIRMAKENKYEFIISHRSGETEDSFIADLAVATGAKYIKSGAPCRSDRTAKYNRLMRIEQILGRGAVYGF